MKIETIIGHLDSNTFVIEHQNTVIVIDAGAPLQKLLKALNGKKPDAVLLTHEHFDHVYYLKDYKKEFSCQFYNSPDYPVTIENEIVIGTIKIKPMLCPGHSPHSVVYQIGNNLFTGDVLFSDTIGRTDLMRNGAKIMQQTLSKLMNVKFETAYHGHYEPSTYAEQQHNIRRFLTK